MPCKTEDPEKTAAGRKAHSATLRRGDFRSSISNRVLNLGFPVSFLNLVARRRRMVTLYVSREQVRNTSSHARAKKAASQRTFRQPMVSAMAPASAGPMDPPSSGAKAMREMGLPRWSVGNMSPTMAGLSTLDVTDRPVKARAAIKTGVLSDMAARTVAKMNRTVAQFTTGYRPNTSDMGAINKGPAASPNSQIVTRRTLDDLLTRPSSRS